MKSKEYIIIYQHDVGGGVLGSKWMGFFKEIENARKRYKELKDQDFINVKICEVIECFDVYEIE